MMRSYSQLIQVHHRPEGLAYLNIKEKAVISVVRHCCLSWDLGKKKSHQDAERSKRIPSSNVSHHLDFKFVWANLVVQIWNLSCDFGHIELLLQGLVFQSDVLRVPQLVLYIWINRKKIIGMVFGLRFKTKRNLSTSLIYFPLCNVS